VRSGVREPDPGEGDLSGSLDKNHRKLGLRIIPGLAQVTQGAMSCRVGRFSGAWVVSRPRRRFLLVDRRFSPVYGGFFERFPFASPGPHPPTGLPRRIPLLPRANDRPLGRKGLEG